MAGDNWSNMDIMVAANLARGVTGPITGSLERVAGRWVNKKMLDVFPSPTSIILSRMKGLISEQAAVDALSASGVNMGQGVQRNNPIANALDVNAQVFTDCWQGVKEQLKLLPSVTDTMRATWRKIITADDSAALTKLLCTNAPWFEKISPLYQDWPSNSELALLANRSILTPDEYRKHLIRQGGYEDKVLHWYEELRHAVPGISDLIRLGLHSAMAPAQADIMGLYNEMPASVRPYSDWGGLDRNVGFGITVDGANVPAKWDNLYWASARTPLGIGDIYKCLHYFRPENMQRFAALGFNVPAFQSVDADRWLKFIGYSKPARDYIVASQYEPLSIRYVKQVYMAGTQNRDWAKGKLLDSGTAPDDAETIIKTWEQESQDKQDAQQAALRKACRRRMATQVENAYGIGIISEGDAVGQLTNLGWAAETASVCLQAAYTQNGIADIKQSLRYIRQNYLSGQFDQNTCQSALIASGIQPDRANEYVSSWTLQLTLKRKHLSSSNILKYYRDMLISRSDAYQYLQNLGWQDPEASLQVADAERQIAQLAQKQEQLSQRNAKQMGAAQAKVQKAAAQVFSQAQAALRKQTPRSLVLKWLKEGTVSQDWAVARLAAIGETAETIALDLQSAGIETAVKDAAESTKQASAIPLNDLHAAAKAGTISQADFSSQLLARGLSPLQVEEELSTYFPGSKAQS